jgi:hypothetical protein
MGALVNTGGSGIVRSLVVFPAAPTVSDTDILRYLLIQGISKSVQRCTEKIFAPAASTITDIFADCHRQTTDFL